MTDIWKEKPSTKYDVVPYEYSNEFYDVEEMDAWLEKVKPYLELAKDIMETFNQNLPPDEVLALYKSRTFTEKRYALLSEALLKAEKLEAIKDMVSTDLSNHDKLSAIEDIIGGD